MSDETQEREAVTWLRQCVTDNPDGQWIGIITPDAAFILAHIDRLTRKLREAQEDAATARDVLVDVIRQRDEAQEIVRLFGITYGEPGTVRDLAEANARLARFEVLGWGLYSPKRQLAGPFGSRKQSNAVRRDDECIVAIIADPGEGTA